MAHARSIRPLAIPILAIACAACAAPGPPPADPNAGREQPILEYQAECSVLRPRESVVRVRWPVPAKPVDVRIEVSPYKDGFSTGRFVSAPAGDPRAVAVFRCRVASSRSPDAGGETAEPPRDPARVAPAREGRHTDRGRPRGAQSGRQLLHPRARRPRPDDTRSGADLPGRLRRNSKGVAKVISKSDLRRVGALISLVPVPVAAVRAGARSRLAVSPSRRSTPIDRRWTTTTRTARRADASTISPSPSEAVPCSPRASGAGCSARPTRAAPGSTCPDTFPPRPGTSRSTRNAASRLCHVILRRQGRERRRHQRQRGRRQLLVSTRRPPPRRPVSVSTRSRRDEPSAFGISIDPDNPNNVLIGTNCGLAISDDRGQTWRFVDPTPSDGADDVWDVVVHHGGIIDLIGDDGHRRSSDGGVSGPDERPVRRRISRSTSRRTSQTSCSRRPAL